jgi:hypothetical protein
LYEKNILNILNNFYYYRYFTIKDGLINKKPIKIEFIVKNNYKEIINNYLNMSNVDKNKKIKLLSEQAFIFNIVYNNIKFEKTSSNIINQTIKRLKQR